ncbi:RHS repeat-associated core domain-containing protein, partial [Roseiconus nitratireducens]
SSDDDNRYTYTGREWDQELELYHFRARMYDPKAGRFIGRDPIGYVGSFLVYENTFQLTNMDPTGYKRTGDDDGDGENDGGSDCFTVSRTPIEPGLGDGSTPNIPTPIPGVSVSVGYSISASGTIAVSICEECCDDGSLVENTKVRATIAVTAEVDLVLGRRIERSFGPLELSGYIGARGALIGRVALSGGGQTDKCNGQDGFDFRVCTNATISGRISGGAMIQASYRWWSYRIGAEVTGSLTAGVKVCMVCNEGGCGLDDADLTSLTYRTGWHACWGACYSGDFISGSIDL